MEMKESTRQLLALAALLILGAIIVAAMGELAKYVLPDGSLYFLMINRVYLAAAALFLVLLGLGKVNLNSLRNTTALFVLLILVLVITWLVDTLASGVLWNGVYPSVYGRIPERYVTLTLQVVDVVGISAGGAGAFLVFLQFLDTVKHVLSRPGGDLEKPGPDK